MQFLDKYSAKRNDSFRTSEWGPEAAEALAREVRVFKVPGTKNGQPITLAEYVDKTPGHLMSKVVLEEIVFDTWYSGRTVLLGDCECTGRSFLCREVDRDELIRDTNNFLCMPMCCPPLTHSACHKVCHNTVC